MEWARPIRTCGAVWLRPTPLSRPLIGCLPLSSAEIIGSFTSFILLHPPPVMDQSVRHQQCILHVRKRDDWIEMIIPSTGKLHFTPAFSRARPLWMPSLACTSSRDIKREMSVMGVNKVRVWDNSRVLLLLLLPRELQSLQIVQEWLKCRDKIEI